jgi:hypothetical protein
MVDASLLLKSGKIDPQAISALNDGPAIAEALAQAAGNEQKAALALAAGRIKAPQARAGLVALLGLEGLPGRSAAWALAQLGAEAELLAAVDAERLDARENGYWGLMVLAARGAASATLVDRLNTLVAREVQRARAGGTGLGEHACRVLAILGASGVDAQVQQVIENDRFCDRFELQRLRKAVQDGGRDQDSIRELTAPFTTLFSEHLISLAPVAPVAPAPSPQAPLAAPAAKTPPAKTPPVAHAAPGGVAPGGPDEEPLPGEEAAAPVAVPIDWKAFASSPECSALNAQSKGLIAQLGPALEQLAVRAIQAPLVDLSGQEFAALLLQVLPQALPQQAVQAALSPQALNAYQALAKYLARTALATHGEELLQGVKLVRRELTEQMRRSGILNGPDYSDPDAPKVK